MVKTLILFFCGTAKARSLFEFLGSRQKSNGAEQRRGKYAPPKNK